MNKTWCSGSTFIEIESMSLSLGKVIQALVLLPLAVLGAQLTPSPGAVSLSRGRTAALLACSTAPPSAHTSSAWSPVFLCPESSLSPGTVPLLAGPLSKGTSTQLVWPQGSTQCSRCYLPDPQSSGFQ